MPPPLGGTTYRADAAQIAELGAQLGALGAEKGAMTALFHELQTVSIESWLKHLPSIVSKMRRWERARFNRLLQLVRGMPEAPIGQGFLNRLTANGPVNSYVDRNEVIRLITGLMEEVPVTHQTQV